MRYRIERVGEAVRLEQQRRRARLSFDVQEKTHSAEGVVVGRSGVHHDVLIPGRAHPYSRVPALNGARFRNGATVTLGFVGGNSGIPVILSAGPSERNKSRRSLIKTASQPWVGLGDWGYIFQSTRRQSTGSEVAVSSEDLTTNSAVVSFGNWLVGWRVLGAWVYTLVDEPWGQCLDRYRLGTLFHFSFGTSILGALVYDWMCVEGEGGHEIYSADTASTLNTSPGWRLTRLNNALQIVWRTPPILPNDGPRSGGIWVHGEHVYAINKEVRAADSYALILRSWSRDTGNPGPVRELDRYIGSSPYMGVLRGGDPPPPHAPWSAGRSEAGSFISTAESARMFPWSPTSTQPSPRLWDGWTSLEVDGAIVVGDIFIPRISASIQLRAYRMDGSTAGVVRGDEASPDRVEFYTPILADSDGRILVRIERVELARVSWSDATVTMTGLVQPPANRQTMGGVIASWEFRPAEGWAVVRRRTLFGSWDMRSSSLTDAWPITDNQIEYDYSVPTGQPQLSGAWAERMFSAPPEGGGPEVDWWLPPEGAGGGQRDYDHVQRRAQIDYRQLYTWLPNSSPYQPELRVVQDIPDDQMGNGTIPSEGYLDRLIPGRDIGSDGNYRADLSVYIQRGYPQVLLANMAVWAGRNIKVSYDATHPHLSTRAYLSADEQLIIFPPNLRPIATSPELYGAKFSWDVPPLDPPPDPDAWTTRLVEFGDVPNPQVDHNVVARTWQGVVVWTHTLPEAAVCSTICSTVDGRTWISWAERHPLGNELENPVRGHIDVLSTATGELLFRNTGNTVYIVPEQFSEPKGWSDLGGTNRGVVVAAGGHVLAPRSNALVQLTPGVD